MTSKKDEKESGGSTFWRVIRYILLVIAVIIFLIPILGSNIIMLGVNNGRNIERENCKKRVAEFYGANVSETKLESMCDAEKQVQEIVSRGRK